MVLGRRLPPSTPTPSACELARESLPHTQPLLTALGGVAPFRFLTRASHLGPRGPREPPARMLSDAAVTGSGADGSEEGGSEGLKRSRHTLGRHSPAGCSLAWRKGKGSARRPAEHADGPARVRAQAPCIGHCAGPPACLAP